MVRRADVSPREYGHEQSESPILTMSQLWKDTLRRSWWDLYCSKGGFLGEVMPRGTEEDHKYSVQHTG